MKSKPPQLVLQTSLLPNFYISVDAASQRQSNGGVFIQNEPELTGNFLN